jgi:pterin-4a-carbinolamine dehydratase
MQIIPFRLATRLVCKPSWTTRKILGSCLVPRTHGHTSVLRVPIRSLSSSSRPDPFARRPNQKCDPYGQGGKPLSMPDAERLLLTVSDNWKLETPLLENDEEEKIPQTIVREFVHEDFIEGSKFLTHVAAVAQMNDHFPTLTLERRLLSRQKAWQVVSTVRCHTRVLQGLSHHDFFLATVRTLGEFYCKCMFFLSHMCVCVCVCVVFPCLSITAN